MSNSVRVRFAPSPTGYLHIGGIRTALYNYLFAKKHGGTFILRIEDTDRNRYVASAEQYITDSLQWAAIEPDEGVGYGGAYGPYRQSERKELYQQYVQQLIEEDKAYYAFDTPEELEAMRERLKAEGKATQQYDAHTRASMKNSLTCTEEETKNWLGSEKPYVVRFKMPKSEEVTFKDEVRGSVTFNTDQLDDKILMKADGMPTYHMANIVDDHLMEISHVIRGEEWLSSTPLHVMLYKAFNWQAPAFVHLPLILKPNGKGKLSKRDGEQHGFPVFPLKWFNDDAQIEQPGFKEIGFLPDAFINMLAFLGWNPGTEQELFSKEALIKQFSLERIQKAGARFDWEKAKWFNQQYLHKMEAKELLPSIKKHCAELVETASDESILSAIDMMKERMIFSTDFKNQAHYLFKQPQNYDEKNVKKRYKAQNVEHFSHLSEQFNALPNWESSAIEQCLKQYLEENELGFGVILPGFRLMLSGTMSGPSVFDIAAFIGKETTLERMKNGMEYFQELIS